MSGAARIQMQHFQVGRLAAPVAVLLSQLQTPGGQSALPVVTTLLANPALLLRALAALHSTASFAATTPLSARLPQLDQDWLDSLIRRSALHLALQDTPPNHAFQLRHWYLARRLALTAAALAEASGFADTTGAASCGLLLRAGMLVLEQQQGAAYAVLTAGPWQQEAQLAAEQELFQLDHVAAGVRLLEGWQLDQFSIDALRYQALPLAQILDAAPLVRICWYANALSAAESPELLRAGRELLGLTVEQVQSALARVHQELQGECTALGLPDLQESLVPPAAVRELAQDAQHKLQLLRQEISTDNMLAQHAGSNADSAAALPTQLTRVLQDAGIEPVFIVLGAGNGSHTLEVRASNRVQAEARDLRITCAAGRNAISALILQGDAGVLSADSPGLTVIDRQLLALLGGQAVLCEPVRAGNHHAALLLGLPEGAMANYLAQHALRRFLRSALQGAAQNSAGVPVSTLLLQQRVREAVHEANNPLAIIKNYLYILGMKLGDGSVAADEIQLIRTEIDRVAGILGALREPGGSASAPQKIDLNKVVSAMQRMFAGAFQTEGRKLGITLQLASGVTTVFASEDAVKQILTNLVKNAAEALDATGQITLVTKTNIYLHDRFCVQLSVTDNGPGIAPEVMTRLFKAGATTKGGTHTGSGLGIVRRLVEEMGGQISCQSDSKGTAIDILLPLAR